MNCFQAPIIVFLFFIVVTSVACAAAPCASDGDCDTQSVCLVDAAGARCTAVSLAVRTLPNGDDAAPLEDGEVDSDIDIDIDVDGIVIRQASTSIAPSARAGAIVMRPVSVLVTRPSGSSDPPRSNP